MRRAQTAAANGATPRYSEPVTRHAELLPLPNAADPIAEAGRAALDLSRAAGCAHPELLPLRDAADPPVLSRVLLARL